MSGWCIKCGRECSNVSDGGRGFCEAHGYVFVDWNPPSPQRQAMLELTDMDTQPEDVDEAELIEKMTKES